MNTLQTPKYPIGHQDFKKIITEGFVYVDKTHHIHRLLTTYKYYFLSRPRRFGKSLLISTLYHLFKGEQALFDDLYISDQWTFQEYPVIHWLPGNALRPGLTASTLCRTSTFPELNHLFDISALAEYNEICGISQTELEANFPQELVRYDKAAIKQWYNGYRWHERSDTVYNPFSLLNFFASQGDFRNYWCSTGTPTFLLQLSRDLGWYDVSQSKLSQTGMSAFSLERLQLLPLLFQTGYLTISGYDELLNTYQLDYPNREVKSSYLEGLLEHYSFNPEPSTPRVT
ncbi:unnamed protein product [Cyprideis torosa]|uniref:AAA-ATPase-like domain-containing protein n=1 Tax=Cyprideis torosa TaxID=163714 RepID=A0A7R8WKX6_9CRUS|nr:unnamed protein product [Cyprideis torosa]CAG0903689.1 unnamed protein product [Cyprideis torosa]